MAPLDSSTVASVRLYAELDVSLKLCSHSISSILGVVWALGSLCVCSSEYSAVKKSCMKTDGERL